MWKVKYLNQLSIFTIRAILGAAFAVLLSRFFYPRANIVYVIALGIFLVGMAYVMEYFRNKKTSNWAKTLNCGPLSFVRRPLLSNKKRIYIFAAGETQK